MIAAVSHCLAAKPRGGRREKRHGQVGRWIIMFKTIILIKPFTGILTLINPNLWARKLFREAKNTLSESWEKCFNKAHKIHIEPKAKLENTISSEEIFSDSGISDLSSDGEFLETDTETESCSYIQSKSKLTRIHQKKLLMCSAELSVKKMLEENGKDVDRYIKQFQSFLSSRKGK